MGFIGSKDPATGMMKVDVGTAIMKVADDNDGTKIYRGTGVFSHPIASGPIIETEYFDFRLEHVAAATVCLAYRLKSNRDEIGGGEWNVIEQYAASMSSGGAALTLTTDAWVRMGSARSWLLYTNMAHLNAYLKDGRFVHYDIVSGVVAGNMYTIKISESIMEGS
jgi:hypothetical protein